MAKHKSHAIYFDSGLNSSTAVHTNIHQTFVLTAMKMHVYLHSVDSSFSHSSSDRGSSEKAALKHRCESRRKGGYWLSEKRIVVSVIAT